MKDRITNLHIGLTGKEQHFYTKYLEVVNIINNCRIRQINYKGNLSINTEKVKQYIKSNSDKYDNIIFSEDVPLQWTGKKELYAFGLFFNLSKNKQIFFSETNEEFWDIYNKDREAIRKLGFWVKKTDEGKWVVFRKSELVQEEINQEDSKQ